MNRRSLLKSLGVMPTLRLLPAETASGVRPVSAKFTPIDLTARFNCSLSDFGSRETVGGQLARTPAGQTELCGIPFVLGPEGAAEKSWIALSTGHHSRATPRIEIGIERTAHYFCLAQFCDWDANETHPSGPDVIERVGQPLAETVLVYDDGQSKRFPIRRRFEVNSQSVRFGHFSFNSVAHPLPFPTRLTDALPNGNYWGSLQQGVGNASAELVWIWAMPNPEPERKVRLLRLEAAGDNLLFICGLTLFHAAENPVRHGRLQLYRITLPEASAGEQRWKVGVDLGTVVRTYSLPGFAPDQWLGAPDAGLGERHGPLPAAACLYAEVTASPAATLVLHDNSTGSSYRFDLRDAATETETAARPAEPRIEVLERDKAWLHGQVVDPASGRPTPVRLAFRSKEGRYIPPYGHRTEVNEEFFQDYGADLKVADSSFAYVDGTFQVELPVGEVYLEMSKGFEFQAVRRKLDIQAGQRELRLEIPRHTDLRTRGWVTADTHVHFLSPTTALLESQAEGLNLINLLAAQWGDLFTNVGDLPHGPLLSPDRETMVWVGTENRQHILGHINLLGGHGAPVWPMSAGGPGESYFGDPLWSSMGNWADACRRREGLVVWPHFPYPTGEVAADMVLGKIDAVELQLRDGIFDTLRFNDWYRYLNCGYRVPAVGGTDKMGAYMPAGAARTYAWIGDDEFNFANWAKAVRRGNTFTTTGPLVLLEAEGRKPGDEIEIPEQGGTIEVKVETLSFVPFHRVEVVFNGQVVASREDPSGTRRMLLQERVKVPGPGWLAARCSSRLGPVTSWMLAVGAHTSPVYLTAPGRELFSPQAAAYFLTLIDGAETWVRELAIHADPASAGRAVKLLREAREHLHRRLHEHNR